jgi:hypothetical protein
MQSSLHAFSHAVCITSHILICSLFLYNLATLSDSCQLAHADVDVSDIERLRAQKEKHMNNIQGMQEELKVIQRKLRQLEDEEARIHKQKVTSVLVTLLCLCCCHIH